MFKSDNGRFTGRKGNASLELERYTQSPEGESLTEKIVKNRIQNETDIILFGSGSGGIRVYEFIEKHITDALKRIKYFVDNNPLKKDKYIKDKIIKSPEDFFTI